MLSGDGVVWTFVVARTRAPTFYPHTASAGSQRLHGLLLGPDGRLVRRGNPIRIPGGSLERELVSTFLRRQEILVCIVLQLDGGKHRLDLMLALGKAPFGLLQVQRAVDERHVREGLRIVAQRHVGA